jgi:hypothetical protein
VHGTQVICLPTQEIAPQADAAVTTEPNQVCVVKTADCLPVLLCSSQGDFVGAAHAGWRGLAAGVLENTVACFKGDSRHLMAWFGPAIGPEAFEVGEEVRAAFPNSDFAFKASGPGHWKANLYELARARLKNLGVTTIYGGGECTYTDQTRFFSYRRLSQTGRMNSLIWITAG